MPEETKHGVECTEFEALLSDALDGEGRLSPALRERFDAHRRVCGICGPLFADVRAGQQWLRSLEAVEPPAHLVHNILAATSGVVSTRPLAARTDGRTTPFGERAREWWDSFLAPVAAFVRQPRFVMSFGMIFFSFSLGLNVMGVKPADVAKVDLRPAALRHAYNDAQIKVVKFYDNIRFVYEIESKVRELKRANTPAEPAPVQPKENRKNDTSGQPDNRQDRNYSQEYNQPVLAALRVGAPFTPVLRDGVWDASPAVTGTTNRRFV
ncbi:MAG: zf-HC2 domain-containing protein [Acidobacteriia bacterium]|nr:zf-HC2 domain-containing protein [Terriglobia bacterium]